MRTPPASRHTQRPLTGRAAARPPAISASDNPKRDTRGGRGQGIDDVVAADQGQADGGTFTVVREA